MKVKYNKSLDIVTIIFNEVPVEESDESQRGIILDYDQKGNVVAIEILEASQKMEYPLQLNYEIEEL